MEEKEYSDFEIDAFSELANIGVGNAATGLSKMINKKVAISLPSTKIIPITKFAEEVGGAEVIMQCLYLKVIGSLNGQALLLFQEKGALEIVDLMMGNPIGTSKQMGELESSSFTEMANILVGSYLNSIANMLGLELFPQPALTANDMAQAVLDAILAEISKRGDKMLSIKTTITIESNIYDGTFIMLFEEESLKLMLDKLKEKYEIDIK